MRKYLDIKNRLIWIRRNMAKGLVIKDRFISSYEVIFYFGNKELDYSRKKEFDSSSSRSYSVAVGDLDDNGSPDIVIANVGEPNKVFLNTQAGNSWD